ncbi:hypothetical protein AN191_16295 [Loktanella sp. 5RATIMAR09]|uniref:hypothetical protein n=1 Tax=Loktanella sp. 5RATIMAR09 TaxID=1225655 RepID=UPI000707F9CA|nr:hypothetical protein [Loktanella sp. 5RATIMAR09]KQI70740.1 hypothetical protein AN191_16295 [Loktanella sp. 5RATIMAR09]
MRFTASLFVIMAMVTLSGCQSDEEQAREILADALQDYAVMQDETVATQDRLIAGNSVSDALERIVDEFGTTDLGLEIAAGGTVGQITAASLRQQIAALEGLRAFERCDEEPTASCVVDRFVAEFNLDDRQELFAQADPTSALLMAMATGETEAAASLFRESAQEEINAFALAYAPTSALDANIVDAGFEAFRRDGAGITATMAAYRVLMGEDGALLREMADQADEGRAFMQVFDKDADLPDRLAEVTSLSQENNLNWNTLRTAGEILNALGVAPTDDLFIAILSHRHGQSAVIEALADEWGDDFDQMMTAFGQEEVMGRVAAVLVDPQSDPRALSLALMTAALHMPVDDLRAAVDGLDGREVMTWDNIRIYPPLVALGFTGDRALFDAVVQILAPADIHNQLEDTWTAGTGLAEGRMAEVVLEDDRLFRATVTAASARATADQLGAFLDDAVGQAGDIPENFERRTNRIDIVEAALSCGMPLILEKMDASVEDVGGVRGGCDRARLGTRAEDMSEAEFEAFLGAADLILAGSPWLMLEIIPVSPARAFALIQTVDDKERRIDLGAFLAISLAQQ